MSNDNEDMRLEVRMLRREVVDLRTKLDVTFDAFSWLLETISATMSNTEFHNIIHTELNGNESLCRTGGRPDRAVFLAQLLKAAG